MQVSVNVCGHMCHREQTQPNLKIHCELIMCVFYEKVTYNLQSSCFNQKFDYWVQARPCPPFCEFHPSVSSCEIY